jgi:hypothetical protein
MPFHSVPFDSDDDETVREERFRRLVRAEMTDERGETQDVVIRNLSLRGIGATAREFAPITGETMTLRLPGGQVVRAVVMWADAMTFGANLKDELNLAALTNAVSRSTQRATQGGKWEVRTGHRVSNGAVDPAKLRLI